MSPILLPLMRCILISFIFFLKDFDDFLLTAGIKLVHSFPVRSFMYRPLNVYPRKSNPVWRYSPFLSLPLQYTIRVLSRFSSSLHSFCLILRLFNIFTAYRSVLQCIIASSAYLSNGYIGFYLSIHLSKT